MSGPSEQAERAETARFNREKRQAKREALKKLIRGQLDPDATPTSIARALGTSDMTVRRLMQEMGLYEPKRRRAA